MATRIALLLFLPSLALSLIWLGARPDWRMLPAAAVGWYLADLLSGATHMYLDYRPCVSGVGLDRLFFYRGSRGSADYAALKKQIMARIGPFERLVFDFKVHHPQPAALGRRSFLYLARSPALFIALPLALALDAACWMGKVPGWLGVGGVFLLFGGALAQYFHGTLHREEAPWDTPWFLAVPRRLGLLMTPEAHERHHATLTRDFSTTSGWSNPLLNLVFRGLRSRGMISPAGLEPT